jgi:hypothetical protein
LGWEVIEMGKKLTAIFLVFLIIIAIGCAGSPNIRKEYSQSTYDVGTEFKEGWILFRDEKYEKSKKLPKGLHVLSYYNKNINYSPEGYVRVWTKSYHSTETTEKDGLYRFFEELWEIDCLGKRRRILQDNISGPREKPVWVYLSPGDSKEALLEIVCSKMSYNIQPPKEEIVDWRFYFHDDHVDILYFYDQRSISYPPTGIVRVWTKVIMGNEEYKNGYIKMRKEAGTPVEGFDYGIVLLEIDCPNKTFRGLTVSDYDKKGIQLSVVSGVTPWEYITQASMGEALYNAVCP